jgi:DNA-binding NtrC family response regulator
VAATHADLEDRVANGRFREDLYYRLNVLEVNVPSLEERRGDIPALVAHFAATLERPLHFTAEAMEALQLAPWPGNVRQLRNLVDRLSVFAVGAVVNQDVVASLSKGRGREARAGATGSSLEELARAVLRLPDADKLQRMEQILVDEALRLSDGNKTAAARLLGVHRKVVARRADRDDEPPSDGQPLDA